MSYDLDLCHPVTGRVLHSEEKHFMRGSIYAVGGTTQLGLAMTYNYADRLYKVINGGIKALDGSLAANAIPILEKAIAQLGNEMGISYWDSTDGNVKTALYQVLAICRMRPDGIWKVT